MPEAVPAKILAAVDWIIQRDLQDGTVRVPIAQLPGPLAWGYAPEPTWRWEDVAEIYRERGWDASYHRQPVGGEHLLLNRP